MSETKRTQTRCYIREDGSALILRTGGNEQVIVIADADGNSLLGRPRIIRLAQEAMALLLLRGVTFNDIAGGQGLPDRSLPKGRAPTPDGQKPMSMIRRVHTQPGGALADAAIVWNGKTGLFERNPMPPPAPPAQPEATATGRHPDDAFGWAWDQIPSSPSTEQPSGGELLPPGDRTTPRRPRW